MDKLQLYITLSHGDFCHKMDINGDDNVRQHIEDVSLAIEDIDYNAKEKHIFYLLKSTDQGVFIVVLRTIPDQVPDYLAAWIYIPYTVDISDTEINHIVEEIVNIVSHPKIDGDDVDRMRELFGKAYSEISNPGATAENAGQHYAHRYYGGYTGDVLSDLIGNKRYQTSYLKYAGIILADKDKVNDIEGDDLTNEPLEQMVRVFPPKCTINDYRPLIFGMPFDKPFLVPLLGTVEIIWESATRPDVSQSVMINRPDMQIEPIAAANPRILAEKPAPEEEEEETPAQAKSTEEPKEPKAETAKAAAAPKPAEKPAGAPARVNEIKAKTAHQNERTYIYNFEIPSKSADIAGIIPFTITSRTRLTESPIDGYELSDDIQEGASRTNHLIYLPSSMLQNNTVWAIGGFLIGMLLTLLCTCIFSGSDTPKADGFEETNAIVAEGDSTKIETDSIPSDITITGAIRYLDGNPKWTKKEMEVYPDLRGLYDDMNNIDRNRIINHWGPKLKESRKFNQIVKHAKQGKNKKPVFSNPKPGQKTFNVGNDQTISVNSYLNCIDH